MVQDRNTFITTDHSKIRMQLNDTRITARMISVNVGLVNIHKHQHIHLQMMMRSQHSSKLATMLFHS
jgi:hypothetical protein